MAFVRRDETDAGYDLKLIEPLSWSASADSLAIARPRPFALGPAIYLAVFLAWVILAISHLQLWYSVWRQSTLAFDTLLAFRYPI